MASSAADKVCPQCGAENDAGFNYCDRCGDSFWEPREPRVRPRYEALERVSNGLRFVARLCGAAGFVCAVGAFAHFWDRSLLVALFVAGAAALGGYALLVAVRAAADLVRLLVDAEDHLRALVAGRPPAPRRP